MPTARVHTRTRLPHGHFRGKSPRGFVSPRTGFPTSQLLFLLPCLLNSSLGRQGVSRAKKKQHKQDSKLATHGRSVALIFFLVLDYQQEGKGGISDFQTCEAPGKRISTVQQKDPKSARIFVTPKLSFPCQCTFNPSPGEKLSHWRVSFFLQRLARSVLHLGCPVWQLWVPLPVVWVAMPRSK